MNRHFTHRDDLPLFMPTNNAGVVVGRIEFDNGSSVTVLPSNEKLVRVVDQHTSPTKHQQGVQAKVIAYLKQHGGIDALTVQKLGTTNARKIFSRLRDKGYLFAADDPAGHEERPNASGQGTYRWHRWTGKE